jgi:hypothetical protein
VHHPKKSTWRLARRVPCATVAAAAMLGAPAQAQTDYYNTDAGRPVRIEDAYATERYAFELQLSPARLVREAGGNYQWESEIALGYGILPRTHIEIEVPFTTMEVPDGSRAGVPGVALSALYSFNAETTSMPALAVAAGAVLPVGEFAPDAVFPSASVLLTRTFTGVRVHANAQYTLGDAEDAGGNAELSRWLAGIAIDRAIPLKSVLLMADAFAEQPLDSNADVAWSVGAGLRAQRTPNLSIDAGLGKRMTGPLQEWYATAGASFVFSIRALMPGGRNDE